MTNRQQEPSKAFRAFASLLVRVPGVTVFLVFSIIIAAVWHLSTTKIYVDTSINSFYSRQSEVSDRVNAAELNFVGIASKSKTFNTTLRSEIIDNLKGGNHATSTVSTSRSQDISGGRRGRQELHILAQANGPSPDIFSESRLQAMCRLSEATLQLADKENACQRTRPIDWVHDEENSCPENSDCYRSYPCVSPWSLMGIRDALTGLGQSALINSLEKLVRSATREETLEMVLKTMSKACSADSNTPGPYLCKYIGHMCDADVCEQSNQCLIGGTNPCIFVTEVNPTAEEIHSIANIPHDRVDAQGCNNLNMTAMQLTLDAAQVLVTWGERSKSIPLAEIMEYLVDQDFGSGPHPLASTVTRIVVLLQGASNLEVYRGGDEENKLRSRNFVDKWQHRLLPEHQGPGMTSYSFRQWDYFSWYSSQQILLDIRWAGGSLVLLMVYVVFQTGSIATTLGVVAGILGSLPLSLWVYRYVFGVDWVGVLTFLGVFIILGIGADDVFVIIEHWKYACNNIERRAGDSATELSGQMAWALQHSISAITATSFTTMAAFAANCISAIAPVRLFGLFMVILVGVNYFLVITLLPALLIMQAKFASKLHSIWPSCEQDGSEGEPLCQAGVEKAWLVESSATSTFPPDTSSPTLICGYNMSHSVGTTARQLVNAMVNASKYGCMQRFFASAYADWAFDFRWLLALVLAVVVTLSSVLTSRLQLPTGRPSIWKPDHNIARYWEDELKFSYGQQLDQISLHVMFGQKVSDHGDLSVPYEAGELVLSPGTNFTSVESQMYILDLCKALEDEVALGRVVENTVRCPHLLLDRYLHDFPEGNTTGLPIAPHRFNEYLKLYSTIPVNLGGGRNIQFATQDMLGKTLFDSHTGVYHPDLDPGLHGQQSLSQEEGDQNWVIKSKAGKDRKTPKPYLNPTADTVACILIDARLVTQWTLPHTALTNAHDYWDSWTQQHLRSAPSDVAPEDAFQTSHAWQLTSTSDAMMSNALNSVQLSLALAFTIVLISTGNVAIALLAILSIGCVVVVFTASMQLLGWTIGVMESVCITVLVGLAVDYIVHIAHGVSIHTETTSSHTAVSNGLRTMGMSILSAACTTIGAALFLLPCTMATFTVFGTFVCITLSTSLVTALVFFPALCSIAGPALHYGDIQRLFVLLKHNFTSYRVSSPREQEIINRTEWSQVAEAPYASPGRHTLSGTDSNKYTSNSQFVVSTPGTGRSLREPRASEHLWDRLWGAFSWKRDAQNGGESACQLASAVADTAGVQEC